jgi:hypothetical protein
MSVRPIEGGPWPALSTQDELAEFKAWIIEARLTGALSHDSAETTLEAIDRRVAYLLASPT